MQPLKIILEKGSDGELWGQLVADGALYTTCGSNVDEVTKSLRELVADGIEHGELPELAHTEPASLIFEYVWRVEALFEGFGFLNITAVARAAGLNPGLLRQYASGVKQPSESTARRIEAALHDMGSRLQAVRLVTGLVVAGILTSTF